MDSARREKLSFKLFNVHQYLFPGHYKKVMDLLVPNLFKIEKVNMGREGDGTYIVPDGLIEEKNTLLTFGISSDISFEEDFIKRYPQTTVFASDPSIDNLPVPNKKITFQKKGVAGQDVPARNMISFDSIIKENKIDGQIIVKMDIEGWEWGIFDKVKFDHYNIPVIMVEFHIMELNSKIHWLLFPYYFWKRYTILKKTLKHYYIYHLHANNYSYTYFKSFVFPRIAELTLIKKTLFHADIIGDTHKYNRPNISDRADVQFPFNR